jgi:hypothetical protein
MEIIEKDSVELVTSLAKLYLNGDENTLNNSYIRSKIFPINKRGKALLLSEMFSKSGKICQSW